jgi:DNA polymerase elongation subunit (family B)
LRSGHFPLDALLVVQKLSRELETYRARSPVARAVEQLQAAGKNLRPGQHVRFVYTRGKPGVYAWDLPQAPDPSTIDLNRYAILLLRAAHTVLEPFGLSEALVQGLAQPTPARQLLLHPDRQNWERPDWTIQ